MGALKTYLPDAASRNAAEESSRILAKLAIPRQPVEMVVDGPDPQHVVLPSGVVELLKDILVTLARGDAVSVMPSHMRLTTVQAA